MAQLSWNDWAHPMLPSVVPGLEPSPEDGQGSLDGDNHEYVYYSGWLSSRATLFDELISYKGRASET